MTAVLGVFNDRQSTEHAIDTLVDKGFSDEFIGVIWRDREISEPEEISVVSYAPHHETAGKEAGKGVVGGAVGGATTGAGAVLLASAGIALLPGIGALLAAGTAAAVAAAATAGAVSGGITGGAIGALIGATDDDATKTAETKRRMRDTLERDGFILSIDLDETDQATETATEALNEAGASEVSVLHGDDAQLRTVQS